MNADAARKPLVDALLGATITVADPDDAAAALESVLGMRRRAEGRLPSGKRFVTMASPGADRGMIRLAEGLSRPDDRLRVGWGSIELVVRDVDRLAEGLQRSKHFRIRTLPVTFDLTTSGSNVHRAAMAWGPGGVLMAFTMALTQPLGRRFTEVQAEVGPVFSVGLRTPDLNRTSNHYRSALGMDTLLELSWRRGEWHSIFGVPEGEEAALRLLKGEGAGTGLGTIEVQSFPSNLLSHPASPAIAWVTYHTRDLGEARSAAERVSEIFQSDDSGFSMVGDVGERLEVTAVAW